MLTSYQLCDAESDISEYLPFYQLLSTSLQTYKTCILLNIYFCKITAIFRNFACFAVAQIRFGIQMRSNLFTKVQFIHKGRITLKMEIKDY